MSRLDHFLVMETIFDQRAALGALYVLYFSAPFGGFDFEVFIQGLSLDRVSTIREEHESVFGIVFVSKEYIESLIVLIANPPNPRGIFLCTDRHSRVGTPAFPYWAQDKGDGRKAHKIIHVIFECLHRFSQGKQTSPHCLGNFEWVHRISQSFWQGGHRSCLPVQASMQVWLQISKSLHFLEHSVLK